MPATPRPVLTPKTPMSDPHSGAPPTTSQHGSPWHSISSSGGTRCEIALNRLYGDLRLISDPIVSKFQVGTPRESLQTPSASFQPYELFWNPLDPDDSPQVLLAFLVSGENSSAIVLPSEISGWKSERLVVRRQQWSTVGIGKAGGCLTDSWSTQPQLFKSPPCPAVPPSSPAPLQQLADCLPHLILIGATIVKATFFLTFTPMCVHRP